MDRERPFVDLDVVWPAESATRSSWLGPAAGLTALANVVCVPHLGSATESTRARMAVIAAENLVAGLDGRLPPNCVNPEARHGS